MAGPKYEPEKWNDCPDPVKRTPPDALIPSFYCFDKEHRQYNNNCYNYACDIQNDEYAQPGKGGKRVFRWLSCDEIARAVLDDGLTKIERVENCSEGCHKVALVIAPGSDFHWYRQDENDNWSHKPAMGLATNRDSSGNIITDPETADRGDYTIFCGYFCACKNRVSIR